MRVFVDYRYQSFFWNLSHNSISTSLYTQWCSILSAFVALFSSHFMLFQAQSVYESIEFCLNSMWIYIFNILASLYIKISVRKCISHKLVLDKIILEDINLPFPPKSVNAKKFGGFKFTNRYRNNLYKACVIVSYFK